MSGIGVNVEVGAGETKIIVIGPAGVISKQALPVANNMMDEAIARRLQQKYKLRIGMKTAEVLKSELGTAILPKSPRSIEVRGRRLVDNSLESVSVSNEDVYEAIADIIGVIISAVKTSVAGVPAEISAAVSARGITLKGGKKLPKNMERALMNATGMAARRG